MLKQHISQSPRGKIKRLDKTLPFEVLGDCGKLEGRSSLFDDAVKGALLEILQSLLRICESKRATIYSAKLKLIVTRFLKEDH